VGGWVWVCASKYGCGRVWVVGCGCVRLSMGADVCGWLGVDVLVCVRTCVSGWVWVCSFVCVDAPQVGSPYEWH